MRRQKDNVWLAVMVIVVALLMALGWRPQALSPVEDPKPYVGGLSFSISKGRFDYQFELRNDEWKATRDGRIITGKIGLEESTVLSQGLRHCGAWSLPSSANQEVGFSSYTLTIAEGGAPSPLWIHRLPGRTHTVHIDGRPSPEHQKLLDYLGTTVVYNAMQQFDRPLTY